MGLNAAIGLGFMVAAAMEPPLVKPGAPGAPGDDAEKISPEASVALGQSRYTAADVRFMQHMIVHHSQAVEMVALIPSRSISPSVQDIGERISMSQASEIAFMETWLTRRGEPTEDVHLGHHGMHGGHGAGHDDHSSEHGEHDHGAHDMHGGTTHEMQKMDPEDIPVMPGMLSPRQMKELAASTGAEFDQLFLSGMILHHQGALDMVTALLSAPGAGEDPEISEFTASVVADQSAEIIRMQNLLADY